MLRYRLRRPAPRRAPLAAPTAVRGPARPPPPLLTRPPPAPDARPPAAPPGRGAAGAAMPGAPSGTRRRRGAPRPPMARRGGAGPARIAAAGGQWDGSGDHAPANRGRRPQPMARGRGGPRLRSAAAGRRCACAERPPCPSESARGDGSAVEDWPLLRPRVHCRASLLCRRRRRSLLTLWHLQNTAVSPGTALGGPSQHCSRCEAPHCHPTGLHLRPAEARQLLPGRCAPAVTRHRPPSRHCTECAASHFKCCTAPMASQSCPDLHGQAAATTRQRSPELLPSLLQYSICPCHCLHTILRLLQTLPALRTQQNPPQPQHGSAPPPWCGTASTTRPHQAAGSLQLPFHCTAQLTPRRQCSFHALPGTLQCPHCTAAL